MYDIDPPAGAMHDLRVVFLNGPPRSGKDTAGRSVKKHLENADTAKLSGPLKRMAHAMVNLPANTPIDAFEAVKDDPRPEFFGMSPRQFYIHVSENIIKPMFGQDYFGRLFLRTMWRRYQLGFRLIAVTDSGFSPEAQPAINHVGASNCLLFRIHADQRGASFNGDSRSYIELPGVLTLDVDNQVDGSEGQAAFEREVVSLTRSFTWLER
jgi:hypothetical protein